MAYQNIVEDFERLPEKAKWLFLHTAFIYGDVLTELQKDKHPIYDKEKGFCAGCESPIEQILFMTYRIIMNSEFEMDECRWCTTIQPQAKISHDGKTYYADFLISTNPDWCESTNMKRFFIVVECDGHEFHEKTKEQVIKRNERDMFLKQHGYDIVHFSGSQIFNHPIETARELIKYVDKKVIESEIIYE